MLKPNMIPDEVVEAAVAMRDRGGSMSDIIRTALNAWPGMRMAAAEQHLADDGMRTFKDRRIILPLPQEPSDE